MPPLTVTSLDNRSTVNAPTPAAAAAKEDDEEVASVVAAAGTVGLFSEEDEDGKEDFITIME